MSQETEGLPQIPWAEKTRVIRASDKYISLRQDTITADVSHNGSVYIEHDSKKEIDGYMTLDPVLTQEVVKYVQACEDGTMSCIEEWVKGQNHPPALDIPDGVKEWRPKSVKAVPPVGWILGELHHGDTAGDDRWRGSRFEYTHFLTPEGIEGLVVLWDQKYYHQSQPEVWIGYIDDFWTEQQSPSDDEDLVNYNEGLENGILWALDRFDFFTDPVKANTDLPAWVVGAISRDPDLLWSELVDRMRPVLSQLLEKLDRAVQRWISRRLRGEEKETGQRYFWPHLYPGMREE